jgi:hypothetical protein
MKMREELMMGKRIGSEFVVGSDNLAQTAAVVNCDILQSAGSLGCKTFPVKRLVPVCFGGLVTQPFLATDHHSFLRAVEHRALEGYVPDDYQ